MKDYDEGFKVENTCFPGGRSLILFSPALNIIVEILQICTHAETLPDRTLNVVGITDTYRAPVFPCLASDFSILFRFRLPGVEKGVWELNFTIVDPDGATIWEQKGQIDATMRLTSQVLFPTWSSG